LPSSSSVARGSDRVGAAHIDGDVFAFVDHATIASMLVSVAMMTRTGRSRLASFPGEQHTSL